LLVNIPQIFFDQAQAGQERFCVTPEHFSKGLLRANIISPVLKDNGLSFKLKVMGILELSTGAIIPMQSGEGKTKMTDDRIWLPGFNSLLQTFSYEDFVEGLGDAGLESFTKYANWWNENEANEAGSNYYNPEFSTKRQGLTAGTVHFDLAIRLNPTTGELAIGMSGVVFENVQLIGMFATTKEGSFIKRGTAPTVSPAVPRTYRPTTTTEVVIPAPAEIKAASRRNYDF
jgi:hypothetical protein